MTANLPFPIIRAPIIAIMLFQVAALFLRSFVDGKLVAAGYDLAFANNLSYLLVVPAVEIILFWPILRDNRDALLSLFPAPDSWLRMISMGVALGFAARLTGWSVILFTGSFGLLGFAPPGLGTDAMIWFACPPLPALLTAIVAAAILTSITEEVINRGLIMGTLLHKTTQYRVVIAVVVSAILFTVLHEPPGMAFAFLFGVLMAVLTLRCQSLLPSMIAHATFNFTRVFDWICLHVTWHPETATAQMKLLGTGAFIAGLLSAIVAIWIAVCARIGTKDSPRS